MSTTRVPMATKLGRMVAHLDGLLLMKSHDRVLKATKLDRMVIYFERFLTLKSFYVFITWSCKVK